MEETTKVNLFKDSLKDSLSQRAKKVFVGGVNSPVRSMRSVGTEPLLIKKGRGARVWDHHHKSYIDYLLSFGDLSPQHPRDQQKRG